MNALLRDAPGLSGPPDSYWNDGSVSADDVIAEWMQDDTRLREACDAVASLAIHSEALISDFHCALVGHPDDRTARALRLLGSIEAKVREDMREEAEAEAAQRNMPDDDFDEDSYRCRRFA